MNETRLAQVSHAKGKQRVVVFRNEETKLMKYCSSSFYIRDRTILIIVLFPVVLTYAYSSTFPLCS